MFVCLCVCVVCSHLGLAMARVIPLVCDTSLVLFANSSHFTHVQVREKNGNITHNFKMLLPSLSLSQGLLSNKDLQVLSKNIYEAFAAD